MHLKFGGPSPSPPKSPPMTAIFNTLAVHASNLRLVSSVLSAVTKTEDEFLCIELLSPLSTDKIYNNIDLCQICNPVKCSILTHLRIVSFLCCMKTVS